MIVDDDISIHQIWKGRLDSMEASDSNIKLFNFTSGKEFKRFPLQQEMIFLMDYELLGQAQNGIDLILQSGIASRSTLVTSRYEEPKIRELCEKHGIKLLPKQLAGFVPIKIQGPKKKYDIVYLDDDPLMRSVWKMAAEERGKSLICFSTGRELTSRLIDIDPESTFFIDSNLAEGEKGEVVAKQIHEMGFQNLYLATGYESNMFKHVTWVKGVVGKDCPL